MSVKRLSIHWTESPLRPGRHSLLGEFDLQRKRIYSLDVGTKVRKTVTLPEEVIESAKQRGVTLASYISDLHSNQRSVRIAYVATVFRGFALLEMARVPIDPAYFELVDGVMGEEEGEKFRKKAASGESYALVKGAADLLGSDTRNQAIGAVLMAAHRAGVLHEGFLEASRLLEATYYR